MASPQDASPNIDFPIPNSCSRDGFPVGSLEQVDDKEVQRLKTILPPKLVQPMTTRESSLTDYQCLQLLSPSRGSVGLSKCSHSYAR